MCISSSSSSNSSSTTSRQSVAAVAEVSRSSSSSSRSGSSKGRSRSRTWTNSTGGGQWHKLGSSSSSRAIFGGIGVISSSNICSSNSVVAVALAVLLVSGATGFTTGTGATACCTAI